MGLCINKDLGANSAGTRLDSVQLLVVLSEVSRGFPYNLLSNI